MTINPQDTPQQAAAPVDDKEMNLVKIRNALQNERQSKIEMENRIRELEAEIKSRSKNSNQEEEDDDEPYVDRKKLTKTLDRFGQNTDLSIQKAMEVAKQRAKEEIKQEMWLENNPDFYDILNHAEKFAQQSPSLAKSILNMPDGFERQKLVYENIKALGIHKPQEAKSSIQNTIDSNRRGPSYQPTGTASAPYGSSSGGKSYSEEEGKNAYAKMMALKKSMRLG